MLILASINIIKSIMYVLEIETGNIMDHSPHKTVDIDYVRQSRGPLLHVNLTIYGA